MKKLFLGLLLLSLSLVSCDKGEDYGASFEGSYKGTYSEAGITFNDVVATVADNGDNELSIGLDLGIVTTSIKATADSNTKFTIPQQTLGSDQVSGTGTLSGSTLSLSFAYTGGVTATFTGEKQ